MTRPVQALVAVAIFTLWSDASWSECAEQTLDEQIERVDTIVFAVLVEAHIEDEEFRRASATFRVHEVLKGAVDDEFVLKTSANHLTGTGVGLLIGTHYLLFFNSDIMGFGRCGGSGRAKVERIDEVRRRIKGEIE